MEHIYQLLKREFNEVFLTNEVPVAALIVDCNNNILAVSNNKRQTQFEICSHAEINVINKIFQMNKSKNLKGLKLFTTLEPCKMCVGAIEQTGLNEVFYFTPNEKFGAIKIADPRIKFTKVENEDTKYYEEKLKEYFRKLR